MRRWITQVLVKEKAMTTGGKILAQLMNDVLSQIKVDITPLNLDNYFGEQLTKYRVQSAFKGYQGYPNHLCIGVNKNIVHGIPTLRKLKEGDLVSVDMGILFHGYYLDMSRSVVVGRDVNKLRPFIAIGQEALSRAINAAKTGNHLGDIGYAIQNYVENECHYTISREFVGHGVGKLLHEDPLVPGYGEPGTGPRLYLGQTLALEVIMIKGSSDSYRTLNDHWTTETLNGDYAAVFENTIYVTRKGGRVLTKIG